MDTTPLPPGLAYAGFGRRLLAFAADAVLLWLVTGAGLLVGFGPEAFDPQAAADLGPAPLLFQLLAPAVLVVACWRIWGATPGKLALGLHLADEETLARPSLGQLVGRYAAQILSVLPFLVGYLWVAIDRRRQSWHDRLSGIVVLHRASDHSSPPNPWLF